MYDLLYLDNMVTPVIVTFVYWFLLVAAAISGLASLISGQILWGFTIAIGGAVSARIACELLIILFKMHEALEDLKDSRTENGDPFA